MILLVNELQLLNAALWQIFVGITLIWLQKYFDDRR
ncbi:hypothetical protein C270_08206 (plasmid) [Leuconostoc carnosum JB16]|uniref:Uncharacterized protein n=2 Tax=Leuconostoc TaxID=1243 RepID=K0DFN0_LEUCJ|nr:hypothetical protein LKI_10646 [Leuconostoc kimchii IMSNU 11154]AFT82517.1 hypothetical protein C270_08206 [Leuconostoc carnosum JB16]